MKLRVAFLFSALFVAVSVPVWAKPSRLVPYEPEFYQVSEAVRTPHTRWAKPLLGPELRVLVIAPWGCQRHTVELAQRLAMKYEVFFTTRRSALGYDESQVRSWAWVEGLFQEEREEELHRFLPGNWDAIVVGSTWSGLPLWARYEIAKCVHEGAGLLIGSRQKGAYLDRMLAAAPAEADLCVGIPAAAFTNLDAFADGRSLATLGGFGKGRIAMLNHSIGGSDREYLTPRENVPASELDYDVYQALAIRALLWASRREAPVEVRALRPAEWTLGEAPEGLILDVTATKAIWRAQVEVAWRDGQGRALARSESAQVIQAGEGRLSVPVPALPAGRAFATVRVLADGAVVAFACLPADVRGAVDIARIGAEDVPLDGKGPVDIALTGPAPADAVLAIRVANAFGQVVCEESVVVPPGAESVPVALALPPALCVWHELTATLEVGGQTVAVRRRELFRDWRRPYDDFSLVAWYGPSNESYYDRLVNQAFRRAGVDTVYASHVWGETAARRCAESVRAGLGVLPYICAVRLPNDGKAPPHQRVPAVTDPAYRAELVAQVKTTVQGFRPFHPVGYSLGDENYFGGSAGNELCAAPTSVAYFQEWLKAKYGTVAELNRAWRREYADFGQAQPVFLPEARKEGNPTPWIDFRLAMEQSWTDVFSLLAREIRTVDGGGLVGHEGSGSLSSFGAFDWWSMLRELDMFVPYPGSPAGGNLVRSLRNPGTMSSYWYGAYTLSCGGRRETTMRYFPWYCLFQGFDSAWYFNTVGHANMAHEVGFAADLRPLPHFAATAAACNEIKTGFDRLLLGSVRANDGIAVYYSPLAIHANTFYDRPVTAEQEFHGIAALLNDLGFQYDYVSYAQLADGSFAKAGYRLLVLPMAEAMTEAEAAAVRSFHAAGGAVLADMPPAIEDAQGVPWATQPLAGLFGVQPAGGDLVFTRNEVGTAVGGKVRTFAIQGGALPPGERVRLANADWARYTALRQTPEGEGMRRAYGAEVLGGMGIEPAVRVLSPAGVPMPDIQTTRFRKGEAEFVVLMPEDFRAVGERTFPAEVVLPEGHLYDMRRGRYLGKRGRLGLDLRTCDPVLIASLPYAVTGLEAEPPKLEPTPQGCSVRWEGSVLAPDGAVAGNHVVRIDLVSPDGETVLPYRQKVWTRGGRFSFSAVLPRNAAAGVWRLVATDVATGMETRSWMEPK